MIGRVSWDIPLSVGGCNHDALYAGPPDYCFASPEGESPTAVAHRVNLILDPIADDLADLAGQAHDVLCRSLSMIFYEAVFGEARLANIGNRAQQLFAFDRFMTMGLPKKRRDLAVTSLLRRNSRSAFFR